jgi:hypothetical protein
LLPDLRSGTKDMDIPCSKEGAQNRVGRHKVRAYAAQSQGTRQ